MFSIVIPSLDEYQNLQVLLPSLVQAGKGHDYEVLVCLAPQNSDATQTLVPGTKVRFIECPVAGRAAQMNVGGQQARGDVLVFLHADTRIPAAFFNAMQKILEDHQAGLFAFDFYPTNFLLSLNAYFTSKKGLFTGAGDQCLFLKKQFYQDLGGFDERQVLMEDFEFFDRLRKAGISYAISPTRLKVSARKYETNSYLRVNLVNLLLFSLYRMGTNPKRLKAIYCRLLKGPQVQQLN